MVLIMVIVLFKTVLEVRYMKLPSKFIPQMYLFFLIKSP